jgi:homoaconitase
MSRAEDLVKQAAAAGLSPSNDFFITPGSEQIRATLEKDHTLQTFEDAGGVVLANACGVSKNLPFRRSPPWEIMC